MLIAVGPAHDIVGVIGWGFAQNVFDRSQGSIAGGINEGFLVKHGETLYWTLDNLVSPLDAAEMGQNRGECGELGQCGLAAFTVF